MADLQKNIAELSDRYDKLKDEAFPLVESFGDVYEVDSIKAQIVRGQTWKVNVTRLLNKFGKDVYNLLTISTLKFRKAFEAGSLGIKGELKGIAKLVDETPKFRLTQKRSLVNIGNGSDLLLLFE